MTNNNETDYQKETPMIVDISTRKAKREALVKVTPHCPPWCVTTATVEEGHCHNGRRRVYEETDPDGQPVFGMTVEAWSITGPVGMVFVRLWQANEEHLPPIEMEHALSPAEARELARLLIEVADEAEGRTP